MSVMSHVMMEARFEEFGMVGINVRTVVDGDGG